MARQEKVEDKVDVVIAGAGASGSTFAAVLAKAGKKVVLIDGERLADLMISHNVGVTTTEVYELKEVSNDFFDEDEA